MTKINYYSFINAQRDISSFEMQENVFPAFADVSETIKSSLTQAYTSSNSNVPAERLLDFTGNWDSILYPLQIERRVASSTTALLSLQNQAIVISNNNRSHNNTIYFDTASQALSSFSFNTQIYKQLYNQSDLVAFQNTYPEYENDNIQDSLNRDPTFIRYKLDNYKLFLDSPPQLPYLFFCQKNLVGNVDGLPVFSGFVKDAFETFKDKCFKLNHITYQYSPFLKNRFPGSHRRNRLKNTHGIKVGVFCDISTFNEKLMETIDASTAKRFTVLELPGWASGSKLNDPIKIAEYTKSQVQKRKACLIPTLFKMQFRDENFELKDCYYFSLVMNTVLSFDSNNNIVAFTRLMNLLNEGSGLKFFNPEKYNQTVYERIGILGYYTNQMLSPLSSTDLGRFIDSYNSQTKPVFLNSSDCDDIFSVKLNIDATIASNLAKINAKYSEIEESIKKLKQSFFKNFIEKHNALTRYVENIKYLARYKSLYESTQMHNIKPILDNLSYSLTLNSAIKEYNDKYESEKNRAYSEKDFIKEDFFVNLAKDDIFIESISFYCGEENITLSSSSDKEAIIQKLSTYKNLNKITSIKSLVLLINKPQKIKVDNNPNLVVVGGPYRVFAEPSSLRISLASLPAVWGYKADTPDNIFIHPHAASITISNIFGPSRCCLGEASPVIHNAAITGNLKMYIYGILIWVRSANSSDPWGRNYICFPKLEDVDFEGITIEKFKKLQEQQNLEVQEEDIESFLVADSEEPDEEDDDEDLPSTDDPVIEEDPLGEVLASPVAIQPQAYTRYAPVN